MYNMHVYVCACVCVMYENVFVFLEFHEIMLYLYVFC